ncbi:Ribosomal RNA small subunit methyltransferase E [Pontiella desulfatans]|uniref:Ribosomal RNA small subunit methyltransferase E n=1 Tax=Pontiella desulfatans TaxID=2750659 RepID=A0A6C2U7M3_PONDE|nr:16S rRNA (uracil(1498)-N(3))-methyltransferase [Pontiella desulfatans]VGO15521.1 Ribosomal RNA small subunit methyltransferase E [Pontiella desulfatans]
MNLIILKAEELDAAGRTVLAGERARHIHKVLKAEPGKRLRIGLLNGAFGMGTVEAVDAGKVVLSCELEPEPPPEPQVDLVLAMPRPKVLKRLWAQLAALGVGRIVLLRADKVERYYFDSHVLDPDFYNKLLIEGLQQARCTHLPQVMIRPLFKPFVEDELEAMFSSHRKLLADPSGEKGLAALLMPKADGRVVLAIGPEGGWTPYELDMFGARGFELFGMGRRILRTDTAAIGLLAMLSMEQA